MLSIAAPRRSSAVGCSSSVALCSSLVVHLYEFVNILAGVVQSRNFVLSAQLALRAQPVVEESGPCRYDFERLQGHVLVALGLVVGVDGLQRAVEYLSELLHVARHLGKLNDPLVAALGVGIHKDGCGRVLFHLCARGYAGLEYALLGIVDDEFLSEGVDEVLCAAGDDEFIGVALRKAYGVADEVSPQSARRADEYGVVASRLCLPERHDVRAGHGVALCVEFVGGAEFVEHLVVNHQEHGRVAQVVLYAEEALAGVVCLDVVHARQVDDVLILLPVWREGHSAVEEHLQVGPHLVDAVRALDLEHAVQHAQHPAGHTADVRDVHVHGGAGYQVALLLEVAQQGYLLLGHAGQVDGTWHILDEYGAQVAHERLGCV